MRGHRSAAAELAAQPAGRNCAAGAAEIVAATQRLLHESFDRHRSQRNGSGNFVLRRERLAVEGLRDDPRPGVREVAVALLRGADLETPGGEVHADHVAAYNPRRRSAGGAGIQVRYVAPVPGTQLAGWSESEYSGEGRQSAGRVWRVNNPW